jgi:hypothetical protein
MVTRSAHLGITVIVVAFCKGPSLKLPVLSSDDAIHLLNLDSGRHVCPSTFYQGISLFGCFV